MTGRILAYCLVCGALFSLVGFRNGLAGMAWWGLGGAVLAAALVPVVRWSGVKGWKLFGIVWPPLILIGSLLTWVEGVIFVTATRHQWVTNLIGSLVLSTLLALVASFLAAPFQLPQSLRQPPPARFGLARILIGVVAGGFVYLALYFLFGSIFYQLFTRPYYESPLLPLREGTKVVGRLGVWFPLIEVGRGALMSLSLAPLAANFRRSRLMLAVTLGSVTWIVGGLAPLLLPNEFMPPRLRVYHIFEIFFQNAGLGLALGYLLRPRERAATTAT
jgi:hypothetical protein